VTAYDPSQWTDFFVAAAGASAALAGLVFVAVSINIERILRFPGLPERGLETVVLLLAVLLVSLVCLVPGQSHVALGLELLAIGLVTGYVVVRQPTRSSDPDVAAERARVRSRWAVRAAAVLPLLIGAATLLAECGGGLYWVVGGIAFAIVGAVANAWVLLVEILR
jgi:dolichol kinase